MVPMRIVHTSSVTGLATSVSVSVCAVVVFFDPASARRVGPSIVIAVPARLTITMALPSSLAVKFVSPAIWLEIEVAIATSTSPPMASC